MKLSTAVLSKGKSVLQDLSVVSLDVMKGQGNVNVCMKEVVNAPKVPSELLATYKTKFIKMLPDFAPACKDSIIKELGISGEKELEGLFSHIDGNPKEMLNSVLKTLRQQKITNKDLREYTQLKCIGETFEDLGDMYTREDFVKDLITDIKAYSSIKELPMFSAYNLRLKDTAQIAEELKNQYYNTDKIANILENINPEMFEELGGKTPFGTQNAYNTLSNLQSRLNGKTSIEGVIKNSEHIKPMPFSVNDEEKGILLIDNIPEGTTPIHKIGKQEIEILIKSNMLTTELLSNEVILEKLKKLNYTKSENCTTPDGGVKSILFNSLELIKKLQEQGQGALSSNEIHVVTDALKTVYRSMSETEKNALVKSVEPKAAEVYKTIRNMKDYLVRTGKGQIKRCPRNKDSVILSVDPLEKGLRTDGEEEFLLKYGDYIFENHFFMRMIDRDLANVTDNASGKIVNLESLMDMISARPHQELGNSGISGLQGHGLNFITRTDNNIKVVDSIMQ